MCDGNSDRAIVHFVMVSKIARMWQGRPSTGRLQRHTKKCLSREKNSIDRTTFAVRTTGRLYETIGHI